MVLTSVLVAVFAVLTGSNLALGAKEVCFLAIGCFNNTTPFNNGGGNLPQSPRIVKTQFHLYTRENRYEPDGLVYTQPKTITGTHFKSNRPTKVIVHGLNSSAKSSWVVELRKALLDHGDYNVLSLDWSRGASILKYDQAVANVPMVATELKTILFLLQNLSGLNLKDVHLIGHSLGAHLSGYTGLLLGGKIGRISGLDPAEPDFKDTSTTVRLDSTDAIFVDVMHTNGRSFDGTLGFGLVTPSGDIDFYINGGMEQPGCDDGIRGALTGLWQSATSPKSLTKTVGGNTACSHSRATKYYIESITSSCKFVSFPCDSYDKFQRGECLECGSNGCGEAGFFAEDFPLAKGKHFLTTFDKTPYCGNHYYHLFIKFSRNQKKTKGDIHLQLRGNNGMWTRSFSVFGRDTDEIGTKDVNRMIVFDKSEKELGGIAGIEGLYKRRTGMFSFFSQAAGSIYLDQIEVTEVGAKQEYVTTNGRRLHSGTRYMFPVKVVPDN